MAHNNDEGNPNYEFDPITGKFTFHLKDSSEKITLSGDDLLEVLSIYTKNVQQVDERCSNLWTRINQIVLYNRLKEKL